MTLKKNNNLMPWHQWLAHYLYFLYLQPLVQQPVHVINTNACANSNINVMVYEAAKFLL